MRFYLKYYLSLNRKNSTIDNLPSLENLKKAYLDYLFKLTDKNIGQIADILNISRTTLLDKLNRYKILR